MSKSIQYFLQAYSPFMAALILFPILPTYGSTGPNNGLIRGLNGVLIQSLPLVSTDSASTEDGSSSVSIKSKILVNDQGAGANVSATTTSPNGGTSQREVDQFTPGAASISTTVNASSSSGAPPSTQITVETPAAPVPQAAIAVNSIKTLQTVTPNNNVPIASPPIALPSITQEIGTTPAIVPVVTTIAPPTVTFTNQPSMVNSANLISTPALTQINTPGATFSVVNSSAIAPPSTTFIPVFAEASIVQNTAVNIGQSNNSNNVKIIRRQATAYETLGMPSRVWPGLGLTQRLYISN